MDNVWSRHSCFIRNFTSIIREELGFSKILAQWVSRINSLDEKNVCLEIYQRLLGHYAEEREDFRTGICGETWIKKIQA